MEYVLRGSRSGGWLGCGVDCRAVLGWQSVTFATVCILKQFYALCVPWLHEKQIEDEPKDGRTEGRIDGRSQSGQSANSWGTAPELNRWPHRQPPLYGQQQKLSLHSGKFWAFLPAPSSKQANTKVNWHNLWHHHQQREVAGGETLIETWFFRHCFMAMLVSILKLTRVREKSSVIPESKRKFDTCRKYFIKYWLAFHQ